MPSIDALNGLVSAPLLLGALAALLLGLVLLAFMRSGAARRLLTSLVVVAIAAICGIVALDRLQQSDRAAERRALAQRYAELSTQAMTPSSALSCLDGAAGEAVENACEKLLFGDPKSTAGAVSYMAARLTLLADGQAFAQGGDPDFVGTLSGLRRSIELDRFGVAAHVLAMRDGCTAERCAAFALLHDTNVIKSNLKAQVYDQYVSRYAADWGKSPPVAVKEAPDVPVASVAPAPGVPVRAPVPDRYDFPSSASIPPVSIMNPEPPLPKEAKDAQAAQTPGEAPGPMAPKRPPVETPQPR